MAVIPTVLLLASDHSDLKPKIIFWFLRARKLVDKRGQNITKNLIFCALRWNRVGKKHQGMRCQNPSVFNEWALPPHTAILWQHSL